MSDLMLLYHGSYIEITNPDFVKCRKNTDFGRGFYTTTNFEQAEKWARIKSERGGSTGEAYVSVFEFDENIKDINIFKFNAPTTEWLDFVVENRRGISVHNFDIVEGPVANDRLYTTITLYEQGILSASACIEQLQSHKLFDQLSFHTPKSLQYLKFVECKKII